MKNSGNIVRLTATQKEVESPFVALCETPAQVERRAERMKRERKARSKKLAFRLLMAEVVILAAALGLWTWALLQVI